MFGIGGLSLALLTSTPFLAQMEATQARTAASDKSAARPTKLAQPPVETRPKP